MGFRLLVFAAALAAFAPGAADRAAAEDVASTELTFGWSPGSGPISAYAVYVARNGGEFPVLPEMVLPFWQQRATVAGELGDRVRVRVAGFSLSLDGISPFSQVSTDYRMVPPEPPADAPSLVWNGSFEQMGTGEPYRTLYGGEPSPIPGWRVSWGSVDWVGSYWDAADGEHSVDLNGVEAGSISQVIATQPGRFYFVTFSLGASQQCGSPQKIFQVVAGDESRGFAIGPDDRSFNDVGWFRPQTPFIFQADGPSTHLSFRSLSYDGDTRCGPTLDDVAVRAATVP